MNILIGLIYFLVWIVILWIGSIALEATGIERKKARFQALSALTNSGFTTSEAESVVDSPRRRRIISYLIFLGNIGIVLFLALVILYARTGIEAPPLRFIALTVTIPVLILIVFWLGLIDKLTNFILRLSGKRKGNKSGILIENIIYHNQQYAFVKLAVNEQAFVCGKHIDDVTKFNGDITVLAIERNGSTLPFPSNENTIQAGDYLLCFGKLSDIEELSSPQTRS